MSTNKKIGFRDKAYDILQRREAEAMEILNALEGTARRAMGPQYKIANYEAFLKNPFHYLVHEYAKKHLSLPEHLDPSPQFESQTGISKMSVKNLHDKWKEAVRVMGSHAPVVAVKGVTSGLKKESFNIYLNPEKKDEYEATKAFVESAKILLEKYYAKSPINLQRFAAPGSVLVGSDGSIEPNADTFGV